MQLYEVWWLQRRYASDKNDVLGLIMLSLKFIGIVECNPGLFLQSRDFGIELA